MYTNIQIFHANKDKKSDYFFKTVGQRRCKMEKPNPKPKPDPNPPVSELISVRFQTLSDFSSDSGRVGHGRLRFGQNSGSSFGPIENIGGTSEIETNIKLWFRAVLLYSISSTFFLLLLHCFVFWHGSINVRFMPPIQNWFCSSHHSVCQWTTYTYCSFPCEWLPCNNLPIRKEQHFDIAYKSSN